MLASQKERSHDCASRPASTGLPRRSASTPRRAVVLQQPGPRLKHPQNVNPLLHGRLLHPRLEQRHLVVGRLPVRFADRHDREPPRLHGATRRPSSSTARRGRWATRRRAGPRTTPARRARRATTATATSSTSSTRSPSRPTGARSSRRPSSATGAATAPSARPSPRSATPVSGPAPAKRSRDPLLRRYVPAGLWRGVGRGLPALPAGLLLPDELVDVRRHALPHGLLLPRRVRDLLGHALRGGVLRQPPVWNSNLQPDFKWGG